MVAGQMGIQISHGRNRARLGVGASPNGACSRAWDPAGAEVEGLCCNFTANQLQAISVGGTVQGLPTLVFFFIDTEMLSHGPTAFQHRAVR